MSLLLQIEDDADYRELVSRKLEDQFFVEAASTVREGLEKLNVKHYDAILLDPGLPDSNQHETYLRIKGAKPDSAIIILTGNDDESFARKQIQDCASGVLVKGKNDLDPLAFASQITRAICTHRICRTLDVASGKGAASCG